MRYIIRSGPFRFKCEIKELCAAVEQLLDDSLSVACNVEDALNVLQSLHYFSGWPQLCRHLKKKTDQVYGMLVDDIAFSVRFYTGNGYRIPSPTVRHSGVCIAATTEYKRITALVNVSVFGQFSYRSFPPTRTLKTGRVRSRQHAAEI